SEVISFYNNPRPFCYTYRIPGEWVGAPHGYISKDGRISSLVSFFPAQVLKRFPSGTLVERSRAALDAEYKKKFGHAPTGASLVPFETARPGTWKYTRGDRQINLAPSFIVDLGPIAVMIVTVEGTGHDDYLARKIIESLRTTTDPPCYTPVLEQVLKN